MTDYLHFPQGGGGGERNTHELCLALTARGIAVAVSCTLRVDGSALSWAARARRQMPPQREYARDTVCGYPAFRGWNHRHLGEVIGRFEPDVVVVQSTDPQPLLISLAPFGIPTVAYFHEVEQIDHLRFLDGLDVPVLANSRFTSERLHAVCGLRSEVVLPLVHPDRYRTRGPADRVLFVNTTPRKGVDTALAIARCCPDIPFSFVLSWTHKPDALTALRTRVEACGNVVLHRPTRDMLPLYARTRLLLAPSQWEEAWGRVATEAHVNGIPVIGSDRGGLPEAIGPGGVVLPADAPAETWASALSTLWRDAEAYARVSRAAREYGRRASIQPDTIVDGLLAILHRAMHGKAPAKASKRVGLRRGFG